MRAAWIAVVGMAVCMHGHAAGKAEKCPREYRGLKVVAKMAAPVLARNRPVSVFISVYNGGKETVPLRPFVHLTWYWLDLEITDPAGRLLDYHGVEGKIIYDEAERTPLRPGHSWDARIDGLHRSYDLDKPGRYRLRAMYGRGPMAECTRGTIVSEPVWFDVK